MYALVRFIAVIFVSLAFLSACAKDPDSSMTAVDDAPESSEASDTSGSQDESDLIEIELANQSGEEVENLLAHTAVYFGFDEAIVTERARQIVEAHAEALVANPTVMLNLAGHADERGTSEYNITLGSERAQSVSDFFTGFGLEAARFGTISFGEEDPLAQGSNEASWARNRRVEFVITAGAGDLGSCPG